MAIQFPNRSRSYYPSGYRVRFWGHDGAMEVSFFLEGDAILQFDPKARRDEASILRSFDSNIARILEVAAKVYAKRRQGAYTLARADF